MQAPFSVTAIICRLTIPPRGDTLAPVKCDDGEETAKAAQRGTQSVRASCGQTGRTTPERPATSGTGPPVTEDTSGPFGGKQGGTVEYVVISHP